MKALRYLANAAAALALALTSVSCSGSDDDEEIIDGPIVVEAPYTLSADKERILADGKDAVTFSITDKNGHVLTPTTQIMASGRQVTAGSTFRIISADGSVVDSKTWAYTGVMDGECQFHAERGAEKSAPVSVTVYGRSEVEKYYHNVAVFKITGTWCTYCPNMTANLKLLETEMPGRLVVLDFHASSSSASDPFHINETFGVADAFGVVGFPSGVFGLEELAKSYSVADLRSSVTNQVGKLATCGIKIESSVADGVVTVNATLASATGGEYDLAYAILQDNIAYTGGTEPSGVYNNVVRALSSNYMAMDKGTTVSLKAGESHSIEFTAAIGAQDPANFRVVVYALVKGESHAVIDNIAACPVGGSVDFKLN